MAVDKGDLSSLLKYRRGEKSESNSIPSTSINQKSIEPESTTPLSTDKTPEISDDLKSISDSAPPKVGRPKGRRSNPNTENTTLILDKKLKAEVIYKLSLKNLEKTPGHKASLSDLVEELLIEWNQSQKIS